MAHALFAHFEVVQLTTITPTVATHRTGPLDGVLHGIEHTSDSQFLIES